ncbi:MAG: STAS domain-containing protein [Acidobacteria bacterium]|nr:STAS domain-containing protein [Candidatus Sulfomarinibacter kjeldsenii]
MLPWTRSLSAIPGTAVPNVPISASLYVRLKMKRSSLSETTARAPLPVVSKTVRTTSSMRSVDIMNRALSSIADTRAHTLMLDIGRVAVVDTAVANHLIKIAKAAVLMGCNTIISSISPAIAQTIAELGIDLGSIQTTSTIEAALRESITKPGSGGRTTGG